MTSMWGLKKLRGLSFRLAACDAGSLAPSFREANPLRGLVCMMSLLSLLSLFVVACNGDNGDRDTDDTDTDTGVDTDTSWDGGTPVPCEGDGGPGMVCVPGNTYLMGCMPYDLECEPSEEPMVEVKLSPFRIDEFEATVEEIIPFLNSFEEEDGYVRWPNLIYKEATDGGPITVIWNSFGGSGILPVCLNEETNEYEWAHTCGELNQELCTEHGIKAAAGGLSWLGAKMYCQWKGKRLPTEAEWEAAARGQTKWIYPCAWWFEACAYGKYDVCKTYDAACGMNLSDYDCCIPFSESDIAKCYSPFGAKGMYGNAAEWVLDHEDANHEWCADGCTDPGPRMAELPVLKGGGVGSSAIQTRISYRAGATNKPGPYSGVRCVTSPVNHVLPDGGVVWGN